MVRFGEGEGTGVQCCGGRRRHTMYAVLGLRCGVPQIARIKLIRKKFMDQLDLHVDFMASNQVDTYGSNRLYFLKF